MPEPAVSQGSETRSRKKRSRKPRPALGRRQLSEEKAKTVSARIPPPGRQVDDLLEGAVPSHMPGRRRQPPRPRPTRIPVHYHRHVPRQRSRLQRRRQRSFLLPLLLLLLLLSGRRGVRRKRANGGGA